MPEKLVSEAFRRAAEHEQFGNCYNNAHAEPFWSCFEAELLDSGSFPGLAEAKFGIRRHIGYYKAEGGIPRSAILP